MSQIKHGMPYELKRFPRAGAVDADGHVTEPAEVWEKYLENKYKPRALRILTDSDGLEYLESDGQPVPFVAKGIISRVHAMGSDPMAPRTYMGSAPYGAMDPYERLDMMDKENLENVILYPTIMLNWEYITPDPEISLAYCRAYNRWIADFCRVGNGRMVAVAQLTLLDIEGSVKEMERAEKDGCRGAFVTLGAPTEKPHAHPDHDPLFAKAQELDIPLTLHVSVDQARYHLARYNWDSYAPKNMFYTLASVPLGTIEAFLGFFHYGVFEKFPNFRLGILEAGAGWLGAFLDRLDALAKADLWRRVRSASKLKPSEYFKRQGFISGDPDEGAMAYAIKYLGPEIFAWATDYPHPDHTASWVPELEELLEHLDERSARLVMGENIKRIYKLN
jgi:uncharacterized protein